MRRLLVRLGVASALLLLVPGWLAADERVDITATDGVQLIGELSGTSGPGVVLVSDGQHDRGVWKGTADALAARGYRVLRFDPRGRGDSGGTAAVAANDRDAEGAYRYVLGRKIRPVFLAGEANGAVAARAVAARVPVAGLVIVGAPEPSTGSPASAPQLLLSGFDALASPRDIDRLVRFLSDAPSSGAR